MTQESQTLQRQAQELAAKIAEAADAKMKEQLRAEPEEGSKGAGLGFMEIARRASKPLEFDFTEIDANHAFFALKATI